MSDMPTVPPERVVQILCREPLGEALWRAAANEALVELLMAQRQDPDAGKE